MEDGEKRWKELTSSRCAGLLILCDGLYDSCVFFSEEERKKSCSQGKCLDMEVPCLSTYYGNYIKLFLMVPRNRELVGSNVVGNYCVYFFDSLYI